jgi:peptide-methionine (S)-S-oxide reductase
MNDNQSSGAQPDTEVATLAGGCFWCLEAAYEQLRDVKKVVSGYSGGQLPNPSYEQVCTGQTGHAEVVQITFDPSVVSFNDLLDIFFLIHDPTTLNRQGYDSGTQYRSAIYYHSDEQKALAEAAITDYTVRKVWDDPIVTEVTALGDFYAAEEYHYQYYQRNSSSGYCQFVIEPKLAKLRKERFAALKA